MSKGHMEALQALKARKPVIWGKPRVIVATTEPLPRSASVTNVVTITPGGKCPTCGCRVPKRESAADRQRASRKRRKAKA